MDFRRHGISTKGYMALDEAIAKERDTRLRWKEKFTKIEEDPQHREYNWTLNFQRMSPQTNAKLLNYSVDKPPPRPGFQRAKTDLHRIDENRIDKCLEKLGIDKTETYRLKVVDMREPNPAEKDLLLHGLSIEHEGRYKYLKTRKVHNPEHKYEFPATSAMEYGWNMYDGQNKLIKRNQLDEMYYATSGILHTNKNGLKDVVGREFYRPNGAISHNDAVRAKFSSN